jgi:hypothetical protein
MFTNGRHISDLVAYVEPEHRDRLKRQIERLVPSDDYVSAAEEFINLES